jgi:hypothetical protein
VEMARRDRGLVSLLMPDGQVARLERTSAFHRAMRLQAPGEDLDAVVDEVSRTWWYEAVEEGFSRAADDASDAPEPGPARASARRGAARRESLGRPAGGPPPATAAPPRSDGTTTRVRRLVRRTLRRAARR